MSTPKPVAVGNATLGIDMVSPETAMPDKTVRDCLDFDIDNVGGLHTRIGATRLATMSGAHSLANLRHQQFSYFAQDGLLRRLDVSGTGLNATTMLTGLTASARMRWFEHADGVFFSNEHEIGVVDTRGARLLGVDEPDEPPGLSAVSGGLAAGRYGVALTFINTLGEESGQSPAAFIDTQGGILVALPDVDLDIVSINVYCTPTNGDEFYLSTTAPAGDLSVALQSAQMTKRSITQFQTRMRAGVGVSVLGGRVYTARGSRLYYSEALAYGRTDPRHNHIGFLSTILFHMPVLDGLYVGTTAGTYFLSGVEPKAHAPRLVDPVPPAADDCILVDASKAGSEAKTLQAVWLSRSGFVYGGPEGAIRSVQSKRVNLSDHGHATMIAFRRNGIDQVQALVEQTAPAYFESARSSSIVN